MNRIRICHLWAGSVLLVLAGALTAHGAVEDVVLWNKLGNTMEVMNSEVGVPGIIGGPQQYAPVQRGNGHALASTAGNTFARFLEPFGTEFPDEGTLEFWWTPGHDENSPANSHYDERFPFHFCPAAAAGWADMELFFGYRPSWSLHHSWVQLACRGHRVMRIFDLDFLEGVPIHFAISWNKMWGDEVWRFYVNGAHVEPIEEVVNGNPLLLIDAVQDWVSEGKPYKLQLHKRDRPDGAADQCDLNEYVDNVILWNVAKTDFSDRIVESPLGPTDCEVDKVTAGDPLSDRFGYRVEIHEDVAVVGTYAHDTAFVFRRSGEQWLEEAMLVGSDTEPGDLFGFDVAIYGDVIVVAARDHAEQRGAAYLFENQGDGVWLETAKLEASDGQAEDWFGAAVDINGERILVGAYRDDENRGALYVFAWNSGNWIEEAKLVASDGVAQDRLGGFVAIHEDRAVGGAIWDDSQRGSAYVFKKIGPDWVQEAKLIPSDASAGDQCGSVAFDGQTIIVGAHQRFHGPGAAWVYQHNGSEWVEMQMLTASDGVQNDEFGYAPAVEGDTIVIGAQQAHSNRPGAAYIFQRQNDVWVEALKITASDGVNGDHFGEGLSMYAGQLAVGAPHDDDNGADSGSVYFYYLPACLEPDVCGLVERLRLSSRRSGNYVKLLARLVTDAPQGTEYKLIADQAFFEVVTIGANGKAAAAWHNPVPGEHQVCIDECGICETIMIEP